MTLSEFQSFVASQPQRFDGVHPVSVADLDGFERQLGHALPAALRWLLGTHGYSECCGVDSLAEAVQRTLALRGSFGLPGNWLLLNDWGDAGIVLIDLPTGRVCWCGAHNAGGLAAGEIDADGDSFDGYPEWVARRVADAD